ncbi:MAG: ATP-binding cassette domain-containing protein [Proteobacteria bacterium]|nr:ATP-binding cassette domain-containing protein [Pseudomonadota bacterium]
MPVEPILSVDDLKVHFPVRKGLFKKTVGQVKAVDGVSFDLFPGETLGLVGESGCGKTTVAKAVVRLVEASAGRVVCRGADLLAMKPRALRRMRSRIQMIFQDPFSSLDPRMTVGNIIGEPIRFHRPDEDVEKRVLEYMEVTGLRAEYYKRYPHEFSGGQRQRIGIARALATNPEIIIADEPVSALDVSIQAKVLNLLRGLQKRFGIAYLFITHDLSVVKHISDRVAVMYLGKIVESCPAGEINVQPLHPYTRALIASIPAPEPRKRKSSLPPMGEIPSPMDSPPGCAFHPRCPWMGDICRGEYPPMEAASPKHRVACHRWREIAGAGRNDSRRRKPFL